MASNPYNIQQDPYLSTDPYAGSPAGAADPTTYQGGPDPNAPWTGGVTGNGQNPMPQPSSTSSTSGPYGGDPTNVDAWLSWMASQPGHDPILDTPQGQAYYKQRISETGGLNANNTSYWQNKATLAANGGAVGAPEGGSGNGSTPVWWNHQPTAEELQNMPGVQWALQNGQNAVQNSAAAKGTLLTGGTLKDLSQNAIGYSLNQAFFPAWAAGNQTNQNNFNDLYNLSQLGFNASTRSATGNPS